MQSHCNDYAVSDFYKEKDQSVIKILRYPSIRRFSSIFSAVEHVEDYSNEYGVLIPGMKFRRLAASLTGGAGPISRTRR